jgi:hypothetical protein
MDVLLPSFISYLSIYHLSIIYLSSIYPGSTQSGDGNTMAGLADTVVFVFVLVQPMFVGRFVVLSGVTV